jgi:hypothetical protein
MNKVTIYVFLDSFMDESIIPSGYAKTKHTKVLITASRRDLTRALRYPGLAIVVIFSKVRAVIICKTIVEDHSKRN